MDTCGSHLELFFTGSLNLLVSEGGLSLINSDINLLNLRLRMKDRKCRKEAYVRTTRCIDYKIRRHK